MNFLLIWPCLLYNHRLIDLTLRLRLFWEWWRACAFDIIRTIWGASLFLGYCSLLLISLDLTLQVPFEFFYPFLYFIDTAFAWIIFLRFRITFHFSFNLLRWSTTLLFIPPPYILILLAQRGLLRFRLALIIMLFLRYKSSISYGNLAMLIFFFNRRFAAWIILSLLSSW